ncbi:Protein argonaute 4 -like protein [Gossypium arboreum]|uniref:Protein argonaute 4-like protein n=1 Tax=Gossypium arboreum TaxID=29729 RepID=A0A0B0MCH4_GOSAR|nr:Protein argonaute 4 -like protein [Gossypium arboreum]
MGALFGFPEQSDVPSIAAIVNSRRVDDGIIKEALLDFYTSSRKRKPDQIIIFRDGVSESQFNQILIKDLLTMCHMVLSLTTKYAIQRTMIFCLGTHAGMIRITRKTHYHVLLDQAGFSADDLQEFVHSLYYMDASETSSSHGGMYALGVISVPQLSRLKDKVSNFILV